MAATADMGEVVEDTHKQEDSPKDEVVLNGDLKDDSKSNDVQDKSSLESDPEPEAEEGMEVDDEEQSKGSSLDNIDGEDSDDSKQEGEDRVDDKSDDETNKAAEIDSTSEVMHSENSADSEIHNVDDNSSSDSEETEEVEDESEDTLDSKISVKNGLNGSEQVKESGAMIVLNDSAETDEIDSDSDIDEMDEDSQPKENGEINHDSPSQEDKDGIDEIVDLDTPIKETQTDPKDMSTPRRSSRNLSRSASYMHEEGHSSSSEESDIEEVMPEDPLASHDDHGIKTKSNPTLRMVPVDKLVKKPQQQQQQQQSSTIVVKDTKRLVEIATKSTNQHTSGSIHSGKKEPTLVIIDTNSILSGRGPIPIAHKSSLGHSSGASPYGSMAVTALPAQGMYPPNMRATITPIPAPKANHHHQQHQHQQQQQQQHHTPSAPILPSLTDDMFVVEAPSFIVPYVYEKPPVHDLKKYVEEIKVELEKRRVEEEKKKAEEKQKLKESKESGSETEEDEEDKKSEKEEERAGKTSPDVVLVKETKKSQIFFESPIGKFFVDIGVGLVQEFVQTDLLKQQKRKREREGGKNSDTNRTIQSLIKSLEFSKENNESFRMDIKKCEFCNYKTESALAMSYHLETPHMKNYVYKCNFCAFEVRSPHDILFHMEAEHCLRGRLERAPAFHQCPSCPFEDNQKGKLSRHLVACARKFKPERNLEPPLDWEPPAKIPRVPRLKQSVLGSPLNSSSAAAAAAAMYQAMTKSGHYQLLPKNMQMQGQAGQLQAHQLQQAMNRGRGRPSLTHQPKQMLPQHMMRTAAALAGQSAPGMVFKQTMSGGSVLVPAAYQLGAGTGGNQLYQVVGQEISGRLGGGPMTFIPNLTSATGITLQSPSNKKSSHQPSISITPLPRGSSASGSPSGSTSAAAAAAAAAAVAGLSNLKASGGDAASGKSSFVICEICDGYIKDLEQLRNHMQWIHKVKIHPKMIYNRPPLNCQKCQFRFFTDQGLERHLLGSHGLVTSSMQEAANKSKDSGRCPVCGRVYQWKLLNHVARDHNMTLKPAHLSYKCTVCTATFGMYKQFENHVYSAHSVVAKRVMDKKQQAAQAAAAASKSVGSSGAGESILKPLKINDEITIIPQMPKSTTITSTSGSGGSGASGGSGSANGTSATTLSKSVAKLNQVVAAATAASLIAQAQASSSTSSSSSSKSTEVVNTALSRAERLARRKTSVGGDI